jgi:anti-anti-sigma factor
LAVSHLAGIESASPLNQSQIFKIMNLKLESESEGVVKVNVSGMLSVSAASTVEPLAELLGEDPYAKRVLLNTAGADRIDSSGVGWLVTCHKRFQSGNGKFVIHSVQPFVANVLKVVRLDRFFEIAPNERQGLIMVKGDSQ